MARELLTYSARNLANWMEYLPSQLQELQLTQLLIPGSHNSANFRDTSIEAIDEAVTCYLGRRQPTKQHYSSGQPTQTLNFNQQLAMGIRYFDIRVEYTESKGLVLMNCKHDFTVSETFQSINDFLDVHPKEVVILDVTAFHNLFEDHHERLINCMTKIFGTKLQHMCPSDELNLKDLWLNEKQVMIIYHDEKVASYRWDCFSGNNLEISDLRTVDNLKKMSAFKVGKRSMDVFHCTRWISKRNAVSRSTLAACTGKKPPMKTWSNLSCKKTGYRLN
ncbi:PI-PLC X domain-containing protein 3-like isoform X2 [Tubulanus polymorphus]|uniref:PI-PLC X domain-containing protein 3-like isoform X2 n=1 Tax=Tubulanus polymorphus TaxID=672921 RepID=UPI003DA5A6F2